MSEHRSEARVRSGASSDERLREEPSAQSEHRSEARVRSGASSDERLREEPSAQSEHRSDESKTDDSSATAPTPEAFGARCSIARTLEVVGERWTFLVVREALRGRTRFAEFRDSLGIASDVLSSRLRTLVDAGIMERRAYREPGSRERFSYHLTPAGVELRLVLGAMQQWGDVHRPSGYGPAAVLRSRKDGGRARVVFLDDDDHELAFDEVVNTAGPGALDPAGFATLS